VSTGVHRCRWRLSFIWSLNRSLAEHVCPGPKPFLLGDSGTGKTHLRIGLGWPPASCPGSLPAVDDARLGCPELLIVQSPRGVQRGQAL
jgi:hypothetical protein